MYVELIAQVKDENTKMALKKWAAAGSPASTAAIMYIECEPTDWPPPLRNGWSLGTTKEPSNMASVYRVMIRRLIFRAPIFILSASASFLLSAAVAAMMSIPTYENITWMIVVLEGEFRDVLFTTSKIINIPHPKKYSGCVSYRSLELSVLALDSIDGIEEWVRIVPIWIRLSAENWVGEGQNKAELTLRSNRMCVVGIWSC